MVPDGHERRRHRRHRKLVNVELVLADREILCRAGDISASGAFLLTKEDLKVEQLVGVRFRMPEGVDARLGARARLVRRVRRAGSEGIAPGYGVQWLRVRAEGDLSAIAWIFEQFFGDPAEGYQPVKPQRTRSAVSYRTRTLGPGGFASEEKSSPGFEVPRGLATPSSADEEIGMGDPRAAESSWARLQVFLRRPGIEEVQVEGPEAGEDTTPGVKPLPPTLSRAEPPPKQPPAEQGAAPPASQPPAPEPQAQIPAERATTPDLQAPTPAERATTPDLQAQTSSTGEISVDAPAVFRIGNVSLLGKLRSVSRKSCLIYSEQQIPQPGSRIKVILPRSKESMGRVLVHLRIREPEESDGEHCFRGDIVGVDEQGHQGAFSRQLRAWARDAAEAESDQER